MKKLLVPDHRHPEATVFTLRRDKHLTLSSGPESSEPWQVLTPGQSPLAAQPQGVPVDSARTGCLHNSRPKAALEDGWERGASEGGSLFALVGAKATMIKTRSALPSFFQPAKYRA